MRVHICCWYYHRFRHNIHVLFAFILFFRRAFKFSCCTFFFKNFDPNLWTQVLFRNHTNSYCMKINFSSFYLLQNLGPEVQNLGHPTPDSQHILHKHFQYQSWNSKRRWRRLIRPYYWICGHNRFIITCSHTTLLLYILHVDDLCIYADNLILTIA